MADVMNLRKLLELRKISIAGTRQKHPSFSLDEQLLTMLRQKK